MVTSIKKSNDSIISLQTDSSDTNVGFQKKNTLREGILYIFEGFDGSVVVVVAVVVAVVVVIESISPTNLCYKFAFALKVYFRVQLMCQTSNFGAMLPNVVFIKDIKNQDLFACNLTFNRKVLLDWKIKACAPRAGP